ncbi:hypothetical protein LTR85_000857 [Meristemomyces frigidus]|nr:hypothetical protein LTR85_000857 [Meristemomyces frigidus]
MPSQHRQGQPKIDDDELPANYRVDRALVVPSADKPDFDTFLDHDLSVERIDVILRHLWLVGRPYPPRPLSVQNVLNRTTVPTNDAWFHAVWAPGKIFLKPLPRYALSDPFYERYLKPGKPHALALGFIFTYLALVPTELDFALAQKDHLLPPDYQWHKWKALVSRILTDYPDNTIYPYIHRRYVYGELRHDRLNNIYRYFRHDWLHGFSPLMGASSYGEFLTKHLGSIVSATAYIILVLTAMQVVLATGIYPHGAFAKASYVFAVFAIVAPLFAIAFVVGALIVMLIANWSRTTASKRKRFKELGIEPPGAARSRVAAGLDTVNLVQFASVPQHCD